MKLSQFNVVHEHNGSLLIMNARTGGILSLNPEYAQKFLEYQLHPNTSHIHPYMYG